MSKIVCYPGVIQPCDADTIDCMHAQVWHTVYVTSQPEALPSPPIWLLTLTGIIIVTAAACLVYEFIRKRRPR